MSHSEHLVTINVHYMDKKKTSQIIVFYVPQKKNEVIQVWKDMKVNR